MFGDLPAPVEIRNQARVHLWYEQKSRIYAPHELADAAFVAWRTNPTRVEY